MSKISELVLMLERKDGSVLKRGQIDFASSRFPNDLEIPTDVDEFFSTVRGGDFCYPPLTCFFLEHAFHKNINDMFFDSMYTQRWERYNQCYVFADCEGPQFSFGIDLNTDDKFGWIFGYEDELLGVSDTSYYLFRSFTEWLEACVNSNEPTVSKFSVGGMGRVLSPSSTGLVSNHPVLQSTKMNKRSGREGKSPRHREGKD